MKRFVIVNNDRGVKGDRYLKREWSNSDAYTYDVSEAAIFKSEGEARRIKMDNEKIIEIQ